MTETMPVLDEDLSGLTPQDWHERLDRIGDAHGYYERLGPEHAALFVDAGPKLLVTFETRDAIRRSPPNHQLWLSTLRREFHTGLGFSSPFHHLVECATN